MLFLWVVKSQAQESRSSQLFFSSIKKDNGLPNNFVRCSVKDSFGFVWFGTSEGLARYEGKNLVKHFSPQNTDALKAFNTSALAIDHNGCLWIGTRPGGVTKYCPTENIWKNYSHQSGNTNSIANNEIIDLYVDSKNNIWVGTEAGLSIIDQSNDKVYSYTIDEKNPHALKSNAILKIHEDQQGRIWIGTWAGGLHLVIGNSDPEDLKFRRFLPSNKFGAAHIWAIDQLSENQIWLGTHESGLFLMELPEDMSLELDSQDWNPSWQVSEADMANENALLSNTIFDLCIDREGNLWLATTFGISKLNKSEVDKMVEGHKILNFENYHSIGNDPNSIADNNVYDLNIDENNLMWISTAGGVSNLNLNPNFISNIYLNQEIIDAPSGQNLAITDNTLWIAAGGLGLITYDLNNEEFTDDAKDLIKKIKTKVVFNINKGQNNDLLFTTYNSLYNYTPQTKEIKSYPFPSKITDQFNQFMSTTIFQETDERIWIGTEMGLILFNTYSEEYTFFRNETNKPKIISGNSITSITKDEYGNLWAGTYGGLNKISYENEKLSSIIFDLNPIINSNVILTLFYHNNKLIIGTNQGICNYDIKEEKFNVSDEITNKLNILSICAINNNQIWGSCTDGIYSSKPDGSGIRIYEKKDGILDTRFGFGGMTYSNNHIYFPQRSGITSVALNKYREPNEKVDLYLTEGTRINTEKGQEEIQLLDKERIELSHNDYFLSISFAALNYTNNHNIIYQYKLEGFDENWISLDKIRPISYTNLKPDEYIFQLRCNANGNGWTYLKNPLQVTVQPAFYQTLWFKILSAILFILSIFTLFRIYTKSIRSKNLKLQKLNSQLNEEILYREKIALELKESENKLKETNADLIRSNTQLEQFAYVASHDLKEPLRTIGTFTELSRRKMVDGNPEVNDYMNMVKNAVNRMHVLIESILTFASVGKSSLKKEKINLSQLIHQNLLDLNQILKEQGTVVTVSELPIIFGDRSQISMLFQNLISNGIKFNTSENPYLKIYPNNNIGLNAIQIIVEDNGIGINKEYQKRIFELFKRLHSNEKFEGTGIGLAVCKKIVELHDGTLDIDSEEGKGSKFIITLPKSGSKHRNIISELANKDFAKN